MNQSRPLVRLLGCDSGKSVLYFSALTSSYTPYGWRHAEHPSCCGFHGTLSEPKPNLILLGHGTRGYNASLMRFDRPDPTAPFDEGGLNSYAYCSGEPVNREDLSGLKWGRLSAVLGRLLGRTAPIAPIRKFERLNLPGVSKPLFKKDNKTIELLNERMNVLDLNSHPANIEHRLPYKLNNGCISLIRPPYVPQITDNYKKYLQKSYDYDKDAFFEKTMNMHTSMR